MALENSYRAAGNSASSDCSEIARIGANLPPHASYMLPVAKRSEIKII
jgi:hypothetical protein